MANNMHNQSTLVEKTLTVLIFIALLYALYQTMSVFLGIFTFAVIFAVPFISLFEKLNVALSGRRKLAAFVYGIVLVSVVAVPLIFLISALADYAQQTIAVFHGIREHHVPELPQWLKDLPWVGEKATAIWSALEADPEKTLALYEPQIRAILGKFLHAGGGIISSSLEIIVGIILAAVLLYNGPSSLEPLRTFFTKLLGKESSDGLVDSAGKAINGVAIGVMGTAVLEGLVSWIGFRVAGIDMATGLAAVIFLLTVVQLGPILVMVPLIIFTFSNGDTGWGIFLVIWLILLFVIDNVVKPILIGKSGKMPTIVLFLGVVGGMSVWGFTGMFKGAVVLAIVYTIFNKWSNKPAVPDTPIPQ